MSIADPHLMLAFEGTRVPDWLRRRLEESPPAGVTLFREWNMESPDQVAELTSELQALNASPSPLLIAADQEGGQLLALPGSTEFGGNMALGAVGDPDLTREVYAAMGRELAAVGINVDYAPVADVATRPDNPSLGVRSFGEDPEQVAAMVGAAVEGLTSEGILATAKHFPGKGEARVDPHYELPRLDVDRERLESVEMVPFRAAIGAGVSLVMTGHYAVPALTGSEDEPMSASASGIDGYLRGELGFNGLVITDALDMKALDQGPAQVVDIIAMLRGGTDLLLCMPDPSLRERVEVAVERGASRGLIPPETLARSRERIEKARKSLGSHGMDPGTVHYAGHGALATRLARRAVTLVRDDHGLLPLRPAPGDSLLSVEPMPTNVTPADTTSLDPPFLASALRGHHPEVVEMVYPHDPQPDDISAILTAAKHHDLVVVATVAAGPGQAQLVRGLLGTGLPVVTVALRTPYDLASYPEARTHLCTYSGRKPSLTALAAVLFGKARARGALPVTIPDTIPVGQGKAG